MCAAVFAVNFSSVAWKGEFLEPYCDPYVRRSTFDTIYLINWNYVSWADFNWKREF